MPTRQGQIQPAPHEQGHVLGGGSFGVDGGDTRIPLPERCQGARDQRYVDGGEGADPQHAAARRTPCVQLGAGRPQQPRHALDVGRQHPAGPGALRALGLPADPVRGDQSR
ncbi:hypothetical protein OG389_35635 [Streptomyces sp. NBC_00435]|uniref:hypothetical protein n=1 Tax=Streptomyces sp. NBC_00435 TaxID=2903649 RepID=UPI002E1A716B